MKQANIIFIMSDDQGYESLSCNGADSLRTPHIDQLAATGINFRHCHATPLMSITFGRAKRRNTSATGIQSSGTMADTSMNWKPLTTIVQTSRTSWPLILSNAPASSHPARW
jgi:hypothetical protein